VCCGYAVLQFIELLELIGFIELLGFVELLEFIGFPLSAAVKKAHSAERIEHSVIWVC
jgi:hypothetical protein